MAKRLSIIEFLLKLNNFIFILIGLAIEFYGIFCLVNWKNDRESHSHNNSKKYEQIALPRALLAIEASSWLSNRLPVAWFIYLLLVIGASLIVISCFGCVGAATRSSCCLCTYSVLLVLLFIAQLVAAAFMFFNHNRQKDMPNDRSGSFNSTYRFFTLNWKIIRWVIIAALALKVIGLVVALYLRYANRVNDYERIVYPEIVRPTAEKRGNPVAAATSTGRKEQTRPVKQ
ncbi:hypothetical protein JCGZ_16702 [Jatropha curcas]|uniref:Uncharacterized protein n=1 Tax=Jatropha curcas TaxID=180498 RepID=A0A067LFW2_JATCU|nr:tobamovirus multiplication protein 2A [Jatropha curcas]KDP43415.1 hypothetical protein JCGZ_16702 [Jatropha curcas]